mmetsp:Transcript_2249/g.7344  ORF Transcript_2249/g.7344 Transcript_2249/m.7344 type:complete len:248 (+) Transcript_2249:846-1589(+)
MSFSTQTGSKTLFSIRPVLSAATLPPSSGWATVVTPKWSTWWCAHCSPSSTSRPSPPAQTRSSSAGSAQWRDSRRGPGRGKARAATSTRLPRSGNHHHSDPPLVSCILQHSPRAMPRHPSAPAPRGHPPPAARTASRPSRRCSHRPPPSSHRHPSGFTTAVKCCRRGTTRPGGARPAKGQTQPGGMTAQPGAKPMGRGTCGLARYQRAGEPILRATGWRHRTAGLGIPGGGLARRSSPRSLRRPTGS